MEPSSKLSGAEVKLLQEALLSAFPTRSALAQMVRIALEENLDAIVAEKNLSAVVFELIGWAEAQGRLDELVAAARYANQGNVELRAFAEERRGPETKASASSLLHLGTLLGGPRSTMAPPRRRADMSPATPVGGVSMMHESGGSGGIERTASFSAARAPNNLPPRRSFVGRGADLTTIAAALSTDHRGAVRVSLYGLAGIGKTALALALAHHVVQNGAYLGGVWWVDADRRPVEALVGLARVLRIVASPQVRGVLAEAMALDTTASQLAEVVLLALKNHDVPSLLVLDNLNSGDWGEHLPGGMVSVLVTTQDERLAIGTRVRVDPLPAEDARALAYLHVTEPETAADVGAFDRVILKQLGALPVAVEMAARSVEQWAHTWTEYERYLSNETADVLEDRDVISKDYTHGALTAIDMSIKRCGVDSPARKLLACIAAFAPNTVPLAWVQECAQLEPGSRLAAKAQATLRALGLVHESADGVSVHRLVHYRVREMTTADEWLPIRRDVVACVTRMLLEPMSNTLADKMDALMPHIDEVLCAAEELGDNEAWIFIAHRLGSHLQRQARYAEALPLFEKAMDRAAPAEDKPELMATCLSNLALLLHDMGRSEEALPLMSQSLELAERIYSPTHTKVAKRLSNLATILRALRRPEEATSLLERALTVVEQEHGLNHPKVAAVLLNLASVRQDTRQSQDARVLLERALTVVETARGPEHPEAVPALHNLGLVLRELGEPDRSRQLLEKALSIVLATHGPRHPRAQAIRGSLSVVEEDKAHPLALRLDPPEEGSMRQARSGEETEAFSMTPANIARTAIAPPSIVYSAAASSNMAVTFLEPRLWMRDDQGSNMRNPSAEAFTPQIVHVDVTGRKHADTVNRDPSHQPPATSPTATSPPDQSTADSVSGSMKKEPPLDQAPVVPTTGFGQDMPLPDQDSAAIEVWVSEERLPPRRETFNRKEINIGRVQGNDLLLPKDGVSKRHARLLRRDGRFIITDLKSTNGTYVNGRKIAQATILRPLDKVYIGNFVLQLGPLAEVMSEVPPQKESNMPQDQPPDNSATSPELPDLLERTLILPPNPFDNDK